MAAPTINSVACQEQVIEAAKLVAKNVEGVDQTGQVSRGYLLSLSNNNNNAIIIKLWECLLKNRSVSKLHTPFTT